MGWMSTFPLSLSDKGRSWLVIEMKAISCKQGKNINKLSICINATDLTNVLGNFIFLIGKPELAT